MPFVFLYTVFMHLVLVFYAVSPLQLMLPKALAVYERQTLGLISLFILLCSLLVSALTLVALRATKLRFPIILLLVAYYVSAFSQSTVYGKIGTYPSSSLLKTLVTAPGAFIAYTASGVTLSNVLAFVAITLLMVFGLYRASSVPRPHGALLSLSPVIVLNAFVLYTAVEELSNWNRTFLFKHSIPQVMWLSVAWDESRGTIDEVLPFLPRPSSPLRVERIEVPPRHIVLIFAECLRADRFPHNGYLKVTTPFLWRTRADWTVFKRAYAHGPSTAESLPVVFNSSYLAGIIRENDGAARFWSDLRSHGIKSAFLSAGAMEWDDLRNRLAINYADSALTASEFNRDSHRYLSSLINDYSVDDSLVEDAYFRFLEELPAETPSFTALHLVGTHFPFRHGRADSSSAAGNPYIHAALGIKQLTSDYENALSELDSKIDRIVEKLRGLGLLEESIVILTSDHGESFGDHGLVLHGTSLFDEQVHVPLLMRIGSKLTVRPHFESQKDQLTGLISLVPTIYGLFRLPAQDMHQGRSLLSSERRDYEILMAPKLETLVGVVSRDEKFIFDLWSGRSFDFNLREDPTELLNRSTVVAKNLSEFLRIATSRIDAKSQPIPSRLSAEPLQ